MRSFRVGLLLVTAAVCVACASKAAPASLSVPAAGNGISDAVPNSWIASDADASILVAWTDVSGSLTGEWTQVTRTSQTAASPSPAQNSLTGQLANGSITIKLEGSWSATGSIDGHTMTIDIPQTDGTLAAVVFRPGTATDYNDAVASLQPAGGTVAPQGTGSDTDGDAKEDLRTVANAMESYATSATSYPPDVSGSGGSISIGGTDVALAPDDVVTVILNQAGTAYCIVANDPDASQPWVYISDDGGLQASAQSCPTSF